MLRRVVIVAARTGVHGCHEHEGAGIADGILGARDIDDAVFEWLSQNLKHASLELWQLVTEEDTIVRKTYFAGLWIGTTAHQCHL